MPYRDIRPSPAAPLPPSLWETLYLWGFVALAPWLVPWVAVRDARVRPHVDLVLAVARELSAPRSGARRTAATTRTA